MFSSGSTGRPKRVARTHGQCAARRSTTPGWGSSPRTASSARSRSSTPTAWAAACSRPSRTGATLVILEDPNPFLLRRQRALELLEQEQATIFPGVPFNFRLMAEAPGLGRPVVAAARLLGRHGAAAAVLRRLPRQVRGAGAPALRLHRGGHADRQHGRGPGGQLRVGRPAGGRRGGAIEDDDGRAGAAPAARRGGGQGPRAHERLRRHGGAQQPGVPRGLLHHRRPRASSTRRAG